MISEDDDILDAHPGDLLLKQIHFLELLERIDSLSWPTNKAFNDFALRALWCAPGRSYNIVITDEVIVRICEKRCHSSCEGCSTNPSERNIRIPRKIEKCIALSFFICPIFTRFCWNGIFEKVMYSMILLWKVLWLELPHETKEHQWCGYQWYCDEKYHNQCTKPKCPHTRKKLFDAMSS